MRAALIRDGRPCSSRGGHLKVQQLGHVVLKVRDRESSEGFYAEVLGLPIAARMDEPPITFFTLGNHHDFAIMAVGTDGPDAAANSPGLEHVAFKVGESIEDLRRAKAYLDALGVEIADIEDHTVSQSIYFNDPDGNAIEVYVDTSDVWRTDRQAVASIAPLTL
ncbi:MAG: VOC family protein [Actinomycetota bacterium]|nr:VOC family protein [Actinomycetota bacterium]